jgi:hypothetical protein
VLGLDADGEGALQLEDGLLDDLPGLRYTGSNHFNDQLLLYRM